MAKMEAKRLMLKTQQDQLKLTEGWRSSRCCNGIWRSSGPPAGESERAVCGEVVDACTVQVPLVATLPLQAHLLPVRRSQACFRVEACSTAINFKHDPEEVTEGRTRYIGHVRCVW